ncbi:MAG TPA: YkgJ family cysteine cluster protein [Pyrinomonadaceae bacterium]|jgi:Fe-S-cluster containining protein|nr:YkgJ family cysteine cluster protein [Pyrinomonadaceae bacterium]
MNESLQDFNELKLIFQGLDFDDICPDCRGQCCQMPWLAGDEDQLANLFPGSIKYIGETPFVLDHNECAFLGPEGKCRIYEMRPLDCRLFPLDIIEEQGEYYWCVFTTCPDWRKMKELFEPLLPLFENKINAALWDQFLKQIKVTKEEYAPYRSGQYVILKKFAGQIA